MVMKMDCVRMDLNPQAVRAPTSSGL